MTEPRNLKKLIADMTLEEKAELCSGAGFWHTKGVERLGIPAIRVADGPHGLRVQKQADDHLGIYTSEPSTCFPTAAGTASSWNVELLREMGAALGEECQAEEVGILLGPGANIKRSPLCGRNFEYYSEDPYLSSRLAAAFIEGVQGQGVGTSLKHFAVNNQEHRRMTVNAVLDERTLREIYLASFEDAVKQAKPWTVMSSYNKVNGEYASENKYLLTDILKEEWGHEGFVVSDWGATNERVKGLAAGLELEMPFDAGSASIMESVQKGELSEEVLDQSLERLLSVVFKSYDSKKADAMYDRDAHHQLARKVAHESMVLLKNEDQILPLPKKGEIAVIGELAASPRFQGGGSSHVNPNKVDDMLSELARAAGEAEIIFSQGYKLAEDAIDSLMSREAVEAAQKADSVLIFAGLPERYESEGYDRIHLSIPANQLSLIQEIAAVQPNVVVVLSNGSPIEMPWLDQAKGVLECYLGGQALGSAAADLIFGDVNPSGKLAESFPKKLEQNPSHPNFPGEGDIVEYREGLFVGYRYYDTKAIEPLFPFGHGSAIQALNIRI